VSGLIERYGWNIKLELIKSSTAGAIPRNPRPASNGQRGANLIGPYL